MNKRFFINILVLLFSFSAFAAKPNIRANTRRANVQHKNAKGAQIPAHVNKGKVIITPIDDANINEQINNEQIEEPTFGESWSKFLRLKWTSLSRYDAWNIGGTVLTCGIIFYLCKNLPRDFNADNVVRPPHDNQGPDRVNNNHIHKPRNTNNNRANDHKPKNTNNNQVNNNQIKNTGDAVQLPHDNNNHIIAPKPKPIETNNNQINNQDRACDVCLDDKKEHEFCILSCCGHNTSCTDCLIEMMDGALKEKTTAQIQCPNRACGRPIDERDIRNITRAHPETYKKYLDVTTKEWLDKNGKHCPTPNCEYVFENDEQIQQSITCPQCRQTYCSNCRVQHSMKMTCKQAEEDFKLTGNKNAADKANEEWLKKNTKPCPQCKAPVEKRGGCLTLKCLQCKHQFCWKCLEPHDHTENHKCGLWENDAEMNQANADLIRILGGQGQQNNFNHPNGLDPFINIIQNMFGNFGNQPFNGMDMFNININGQRAGMAGQRQPINQPNIVNPGQNNVNNNHNANNNRNNANIGNPIRNNANNNQPNNANQVRNANNNRPNGVAANPVRNNANNNRNVNNAHNANRNNVNNANRNNRQGR